MSSPTADPDYGEQELLQQFRAPATREAAFAKLVQRYQERLYWCIRRLVVVHADADDVLQNVFIKVWKNLEGFRGESGLYTWMYRIATNETLTWLEREKKRRSVAIDQEDGFLADRLVAEKGFDPKKIEWKLQQAIQALPEKQRIVFTLRYYDEMSYEKMSSVLDTSAGALKASYHHAVKKVEQHLLRD